MKEFKIGDVVQLISGGPKMTVNKLTSEGIETLWFVGDDLLNRLFSKDSLEKV